MGVDLSVWTRELLTHLAFIVPFAGVFYVLVTGRLVGSGPWRSRPIILAGGLGFAVVALVLQLARLSYLGQPATPFEIVMLALGFLAMGLGGSALSIRWLRRQQPIGAPSLQGALSVLWRFWVGATGAMILYHLVAGGLLFLLFL
jgi:hypothetical protein